MRKIIETTSTLALWAVWLVGSGHAIADLLSEAGLAKGTAHQLSVIAWSPLVAGLVLALMMVAIRLFKASHEKTTHQSEHAPQWSAADFMRAQNSKVVDLSFEGLGLACQVSTRSEAAAVLHNENQIPHTGFTPARTGESSAWFWRKIVARSLVLIVTLFPLFPKVF